MEHLTGHPKRVADFATYGHDHDLGVRLIHSVQDPEITET
jgi:hypothetical protein